MNKLKLEKDKAKEENSYSWKVRYPSACYILRTPRKMHGSSTCAQNLICMSKQRKVIIYYSLNES